MQQAQREAIQDEPTIILGGGIAGLAASYACGAAVYEADDRPGGVAASDCVDGFTFDRGIHVLQTGNARILRLLDELGIRLIEHSRRAFIYSHQTYTPYPFQVNTAGLPLSVRLRCVFGYLTRQRGAQPRTYEDWIYASIGRGFGDTFLIPYSKKFWTVHPREMTHDWTGNRIPQPKTLQVLRGALWSKQTRLGTNGIFRYPANPGGYGAIATALSRKAGPVHGGQRATQIDLHNHRVRFAGNSTVCYRRMISTIPLPELVRMCADVPATVRAAAAKLRTNSILAVNLGVARADVGGDWHWAHYPETDVSFFRISFPHNFAPGLAPPGMSSVSAEVAYSPEHGIDREATIARVVDDLIRVRILRSSDRIVCRTAWNIPYAYCIYDLERKAAARALRDWLSGFDVIPAGRYGMWTYFWSDEAIMSGLQAGEKVLRLASGAQEAREPSLAAG
jgi:protoporphyrinogen oxidase